MPYRGAFPCATPRSLGLTRPNTIRRRRLRDGVVAGFMAASDEPKKAFHSPRICATRLYFGLLFLGEALCWPFCDSAVVAGSVDGGFYCF